MNKTKNEEILVKSKVSYLGINILFKELRTLSWKGKLFLAILAVLFTLDTLILNYGTASGSHFTGLGDTSLARETNGIDGGHSGGTNSFYHYGYASKVTNGITAFVGVTNVILISKRKVTNFFGGILSCIFYGNYAFSAGYTGDALLNLFFYLPMSFVGGHLGFKNFDTKDDVVKVNVFRGFYGIILIIFLTVVTIAGYYVIPVIDEALRRALFNDNEGYYFAGEFGPHFFDAFTNALGVASTFLMYGRFGQEFMLYIIKDTIGLVMGSGAFHTDILGLDLSMVINMLAYMLAGAAGLGVGMDATPTGRAIKTTLPFVNKTY